MDIQEEYSRGYRDALKNATQGFLAIIRTHREEKFLPLFLVTNSIKDPNILQSVLEEVTQVVTEIYGSDYKWIEDIAVYDFSGFRFYEYGLTKEDVFIFLENEIIDLDSQCLKKDMFGNRLAEIKEKQDSAGG